MKVDVDGLAEAMDLGVVGGGPAGASGALEHLCDLVKECGVGLVHESADGVAEKQEAVANDHKSEEARNDGVESGPAGELHNDQACDDAEGGDGVGAEVLAAGDDGGRLEFLPAGDADGAEGPEDEGDEDFDGEAERELCLDELGGTEGVLHRDDGDGNAGDQDERPLDAGGEVLDLSVAVGVVFVAGLRGEPECVERERGGSDVGNRLKGVGEDGRASGHPPSGNLRGRQRKVEQKQVAAPAERKAPLIHRRCGARLGVAGCHGAFSRSERKGTA